MSKALRSVFVVAAAVCAMAMVSGGVIAAALQGLGAPVTVADTPADSKDPAVAYGGSITHVVWVESDQIVHSWNAGAGWSTPVTAAIGTDPALIVDGGGVPHLVFTEFFTPTDNIYHTRYMTGTWEAPRRVSGGTNIASAPDIAIGPNGTLYIVWSELVGAAKQIRYSSSINGGATWTSDQPIPNAEGSGPELAIGSDGAIHIVWQDALSPFRIKHTQRVTTEWSLPASLSVAGVSAFAPDVASSGGKAHVVWEQSSSIRYATIANLQQSTPVTLSSGSAKSPAIAANGQGALIAAWDSGVTITLRMGGPGGWGAEQVLGSSSAISIGQVGLASGPAGSVYAVFSSPDPNNRNIVFNSFSTQAVYLPLVMKSYP